MFIIALFTKAKIWKHSKCPSTDEGIKIQNICVCIYIHEFEQSPGDAEG